eukprot:15440937-Alexandrium_andersonii.AAC.1
MPLFTRATPQSMHHAVVHIVRSSPWLVTAPPSDGGGRCRGGRRAATSSSRQRRSTASYAVPSLVSSGADCWPCRRSPTRDGREGPSPRKGRLGSGAIKTCPWTSRFPASHAAGWHMGAGLHNIPGRRAFGEHSPRVAGGPAPLRSGDPRCNHPAVLPRGVSGHLPL